MINILVDRSGSMFENGKPMLVINLLRYIRQTIDLDKLKIFAINSQFYSIDISSDSDIELPEITGSLDTEKAIEFLCQHEFEPTLFLSDGFFELSDSQKRILKQQQQMIIVAVGADADVSGLKPLRLPVYLAQDIGFAVEQASKTIPESNLTPPLKRGDVQFNNSSLVTEPVSEEEDGWE